MKVTKYMNALKRSPAKTGERVFSSLWPQRGTGWPGGWSADRVEQVLHFKNWTYVAIDCIAAKVASIVPNTAYVHDEPVKGVTTKAWARGGLIGGFGSTGMVSQGGHSFLTMGEYRSKALSVVKPHEDLSPLPNDHKLRQLIDNPNAVDTWFDLSYELQMFEDLTGVSYLWMVPNAYGMPDELWVLPSHWVWPRTGGGKYVRPDNENDTHLISHYEIRPWGGMGSAGTKFIPANEVVMTRWKSPVNKLDGYSKLGAIAQWIDSEESISRSRWAQFMNEARPEFWVKLPPGYEDPDDDRVKRIEAKIYAKLQGELNYGKPLVTGPGIEISPLSFNPTEMAYYQCHDEATECLTRQGWKKYTELTTDTEVACYDRETGITSFMKPSAVHISRYSGPMHRWKSNHLDALMTPNHRCHVKQYWVNDPSNAGSWGTLLASEVDVTPKSVAHKVLSAAPYGVQSEAPETVKIPHFTGWRQRDEQAPYEIPLDDWLRFLGSFIAEGYSADRSGKTNGWSVVLTQSWKHEKFVKFSQSVLAMPFKWHNVLTASSCMNFTTGERGLWEHLTEHCGQGSYNKRIPQYAKDLPAEKLLILLEALVAGDGSRRHDARGFSAQYWTRSKQLADDVQEIATKCGLRATLTTTQDKREKYQGRLGYAVNITPVVESSLRLCNKSVEEYTGDVWCLTVPTGAFVIRRNGKIHTSLNSEEQIRDMILSTFRVPKAAVGISSDMTYGSILATLAALCTYCLNPRLVLRGQTLTKFLASKWDRPGRKVRLWYDDCVPADPQQVNSDIQVDMSANAITPNEIRAMRGRKSYRFGGDDPLVQGPGGIMPLPLNTGEEQDELASLVAEYAKASQGGEEQGAEGEQPGGAPPEVGAEGQPQTPEAPSANPLEALMGQQQQKGYKTVAVDLDGTILERAEFPHFGPPRPGAKEAMEKLRDSGAEVVVWTVRDDAESVAEELRRHGIHFDDVNNSGKKHLAEVYIDDRGVDGREDWADIVKTLLNVDALIFAVEDHDKHLGLSLLSVGYGIAPEDLISLEDEPHITLVSNLDAGAAEVAEKLKGTGPVTATLGATSLFRTAEHDVLIVPVHSDKLGEMHRKVRELPNEWRHPAYQPHVTIAYLKPGTGHKYVGIDDVEGAELPLRTLSLYNGRGDISERMQLV